MGYTMKVVEIEGASEHELPADTVTRDSPPRSPSQALASPGRQAAEAARACAHGPLLPLAFRPRDDVFYVDTARWPDLVGKALRLKAS
jgi:hypothetical protein